MQEGDDLRRRALNDDRRRRFGSLGREIALLCECGDAACTRAVTLSVEQYDALRPGVILHAEHPAVRQEQPPA